MITSMFSRFCFFSLGIGFFAVPWTSSLAQTTVPQGVGARDVLNQLSAAFSGGQIVQRVQLTGNAAWYAGSLEDNGTVSLTASTDGSSQMQLDLGTTGPRTESQTGVGADAACRWAGADGVAHEIATESCLGQTLWVMPALSLQPSILAGSVSVVDLGSGPVGAGETAYRHLQSHPMVSAASSVMPTHNAQLSTADIGLDPVSALPAVLTYSVHPDNGAQISIAIEVHYSDYRSVNGVQIPFHIQRYLNGSLRLDILLSSAQIN